MAVSKTYIAVVILLLILIGFVLTVIRTLASSAGARIRNDMNHILGTYDKLIEKKTEEYKALQPKIEKLNLLKKGELNLSGATASVGTAPAAGSLRSTSNFVKNEVSHRDNALAEGYEVIKDQFRESNTKLEDVVRTASDEFKPSDLCLAAKRIEEAMSFDTVYELSTESPAEQLAFFSNVLQKDDAFVLDRYLEVSSAAKFNTIAFYDWIRSKAQEATQQLVVRAATPYGSMVYEPSICEGYQVIVGNKLYDYSISKRDIR